MNQFEIEKHGTETYLVYTVSEHETIDSFCRGMLTNNNINGIASVMFTQQNANRFLKFDITGKVSLKQYFSAVVSKKKLLSVFSSIVNTLILANEYMLETSSFILDMEHIYVDVASKEVTLLCLPIENASITINDVLSFFKNIMFNTQFEQVDYPQNCEYVARLVTYLNTPSSFSLLTFKDVIDSLIRNEPVRIINTNTNPITSDSISIGGSDITKRNTHPVKEMPGTLPKKPEKQVAVKKSTVVSAAPHLAEVDEDRISLFYLLQHYNKENAAKYKAQKEAAKNRSNAVADSAPQPDIDEEKISLFYLLQHYNKENAAKYKAQKEAAKGKKNTTATKPAPGKNSAKQTNVGYAVPGKQSANQINVGYAVPGKHSSPVDSSARTSYPDEFNHTESARNAAPAKRPPVNIQDLDFGDTIVLQYAAGSTDVISFGSDSTPKGSMPTPYLIRKKNNEKIVIDKPIFRIGTEKGAVDYCITDNEAVSHTHAEITVTENECFIIDLESTNYTFVDGKKIPSGQAVSLKNGYSVRFATEKFEFFIL